METEIRALENLILKEFCNQISPVMAGLPQVYVSRIGWMGDEVREQLGEETE